MAYTPRELPVSNEYTQTLTEFLFAELLEISKQFSKVEAIQLPELHAAPVRPRTGMIVLADGTDWDPGAGQGLYVYYGGAWNRL